MQRSPTQDFYNAERYTSLDMSDLLGKLKSKTIPIFGLYGQEDGLFGAAQLEKLKIILGADHFQLISDASHNIYIDQQAIFLDFFQKTIKN